MNSSETSTHNKEIQKRKIFNIQDKENIKPQKLSNIQLKISLSYEKIGDYMYSSSNILGKGSFSTVYLGEKLSNRKKVAIKEIDLNKGDRNIIEEIFLTKQSKSKYVVAFYDFYLSHSTNKCYLVLEYCSQGNLENYRAYRLETNIRKLYCLFQQILHGMKILRNNNIIHRDLKLSNILIDNNQIKISDFGLAKYMGRSEFVLSQKCGTPSTMAPEIINQHSNFVKFTNKCDIWSLGIILHELIYGKHPFELNKNRLDKGERIFINITYPLAEDFINKCLVINEQKRINWDEIFNHPICFIDDDEEYLKWKKKNGQ